MKHLTHWIIGILVLFSISNLLAQDKLVLTLDGSMELAFKNNPRYQIALREVKKANASIGEAYSNILPQINASANLQHSWDIQESTIPNFIKAGLGSSFPGYDQMDDFIRLSFGLENTLTYGAILTQPLFLGGAGVAGIRAANAAERAMESNLEATRQNLIYNTANAFYACLVAKEVAIVQEEALEQAQENYEMVEKKYNAGAASKFDLMRAKVNVANLRPNAISARNNFKTALTQLNVVLALPMKNEIEVTGLLEYTNDDFTTLDLAEYQKMALGSRPEVQAMNEQKNISKRGISIAKSAFMPKLFFQTDYSYLGMRSDLEFNNDDFSKGFTSALSLQLPLFTGMKNNKQFQKSKIDYNIMLDTEKQMTDGIAAEVEAVYNKFFEAKEKYQSANENVELAEETFRLATMMYDEGTNTQLDVFTAQLGLTSARLNYLTSLYEYQLTRYALRKATGQLKEII
jgi:outer membrane protein